MLSVVKIGGSLYCEPELAVWLKTLAAIDKRIVIVPGGGPFADTVRQLQKQTGISDTTAHQMALLAMEQYGLLLCDMQTGLTPANNQDEIFKALNKGKIPVWLPSQMCMHATGITQDWSMTSDSLAAWLASILDAESLILIKHGNPADDMGLDTLSTAGWVDAAFPNYASQFGRTIKIFGRNESHRFKDVHAH